MRNFIHVMWRTLKKSKLKKIKCAEDIEQSIIRPE